VDLSEDSVAMARQRLAYHKIENVEFHAMPIERLSDLAMEFDYINCDDVLYFVPDPIQALAAMKSVLKPGGIMRVNYHSQYGRMMFISAQNFFRKLGCIQGVPDQAEIALVRQTMEALKPQVNLRSTWDKSYLERDEAVLANHLLQNDKTWSIHQFFEAMAAAKLEFISMVDWWTWNLVDLFQNVDDLPLELVMRLSELSIEDQLAIHESIHMSSHRLLDIWCGNSDQSQEYKLIEDWSEADWYAAKVHFHPQLMGQTFAEALRDCAAKGKMLSSSGYMRTTTAEQSSTLIDNLTTGCLLPLLEGGRSFPDLINRWLHLRPINPVTMDPSKPEEAFETLHQILTELERIGYVMLETGSTES
jgi:SAM-dependent methyltransferase